MGIAVENKKVLKRFADVQSTLDRAAFNKAAEDFFSRDAKINIVHPFNGLTGGAQYCDRFLNSLMASFEGLHRRDYILMGGSFLGNHWVSATGYYAGEFVRPWLGIKPSRALAFLRFGEFHRMENGKAVESYIFLDIPELMIAVGQWPIVNGPGRDRGYTGYLPGPATGDGILVEAQDDEDSRKSYEIVTTMLSKLATADEAWRPYWHDNMMWYGPAAFGSFIGRENFAGFQVPFEQTFSSWVGGSKEGSETKHFTRYGDGKYCCSGGWPSLNAFQIKPFLDQPATNKTLYMRVCDWWRREGDLLAENWVFVDIPHVLLQMGYDVFEELDAR